MIRIPLFGIGIDAISFSECISTIEKAVTDKMNVFVVTPNVDHLMKLRHDQEFRAIYRQAFLSVADGVPLLWAMRFLGTPLKGRINGTDLLVSLTELSARKGYSVFFLGGRPGAAEKAKVRLEQTCPGVRIAGCYAPPLGFENDPVENAKIRDMIKAASPDLLFVGFGAPKQEKWIYNWHKELNVPVSIGIGVSFELIAGMISRAPVWMQKNGFEWFWRLLAEPGRLWKRYLVDDLRFFPMILREKIARAS
jgi:N-acetylglucosaminyldiphosphoundecaprenol N-acetyl-beta-D-mannosaminyltransferase